MPEHHPGHADGWRKRTESCFGADSYRGSVEEYEEVFDYAYDILHAKKRHLEEYYDDPLEEPYRKHSEGDFEPMDYHGKLPEVRDVTDGGYYSFYHSEYERVERLLDEAKKDVQELTRSDLGEDSPPARTPRAIARR